MIEISSSKLLKERPKAILLLAGSATMWSLGGLLIKSLHAHPLAIAGIRSSRVLE